MANKGVLGSFTSNQGNRTFTVYTVPATVDHAVVHITLDQTETVGGLSATNEPAYVMLNGAKFFKSLHFPNPNGTNPTRGMHPGSYSAILKGGDTVSYFTGQGTSGTRPIWCMVTGYEVDA